MDYIFLQIRDEFIRLYREEQKRDEGMSAKDCAHIILDQLDEEQYPIELYLKLLLWSVA